MKYKYFALTIFVGALGGPLYPAELRVSATGDAPFAKVQDCLSAAKPGDACVVGPGLYQETIKFVQPGSSDALIKLTAENPVSNSAAANRSIIDGGVTLLAFTEISGFELINHGVSIGGNGARVVGNLIHGVGENSIGVAVNFQRTSPKLPYYSDITVKDNTLAQMSYGMFIHCSARCLIENNEITHLFTTPACRPAGACRGDVDNVRMFGDGIIFRNNRIHGSTLDEIDADAHVDGIQSFTNGGLGGQGRDTLSNTIIENNLIQDVHQAIWWTTSTQSFNGIPMVSTNVTIRNNMFLNTWGTSARMSIGGPIADDLFIYNNVFHQSVRVMVKSRSLVKNNVVFGNYMNTADDRFSWPQGTSEFDHNIVFFDGWLNKGLRNYPTLVASNILDPDRTLVFIDSKNKDYHLKDGSPAIDAGADLRATGFTYDYFGGRRPFGSAWDIGIHEFGSTPAPLPPPIVVVPVKSEPIAKSGSGPGNFLECNGYFNPLISPLEILVKPDAEHTTTLSVYNRQGVVVKKLLDEKISQDLTLSWNGFNEQGEIVSAGAYSLVLDSGSHQQKRKFVVVK